MSEQEEKTSVSVSEMLRLTGQNTSTFMFKIADHIEMLEQEIRKLSDRIIELESKQ